MNLLTLQVGTYEVNCSLLEKDGQTLIIDPGQDPDRILAALDQRGWTPAAILLTHAHFDHINGIPGLLKRHPDLPVYIASADAQVISHPLNICPPEYVRVTIPAANLRAFDPNEPSVLANSLSKCNQSALARDLAVKVISTPGHTPGGVCYHIPAEKLLFSGDTLFAGSVGRTDLPCGDMATLMSSLDSLRLLPEDTTVIPGHGMSTTIGRELASNPFLSH